VGIGAVVEQKVYDIRVVFPGSQVQSHATMSSFEINTVLEEKPDNLGIRTQDRELQYTAIPLTL
jgi:hypothetical protein